MARFAPGLCIFWRGVVGLYHGTVAIGAREEKLRRELRALLASWGWTVVGEAADGAGMLRLVHGARPDVVVLDEELEGVDGLEVVRRLGSEYAVVLVTPYPQGRALDALQDLWVFGLVTRPVEETSLRLALALATAGFQKVRRLEREVGELKEKLETRKAVERAKGILMEVLGLSEAEAYRRMQRQSMDRRASMRTIAEAIITTYELQRGALEKPPPQRKKR